MKLLLHCCCAPCTISCVKTFYDEKFEPHLFWYNPNIHPYTEYKSRYDCLCQYADKEKLKLTGEGEYTLNTFMNEVYNGTKNQSCSRCQKCYKLRLEKTAALTSSEGFSGFSTTLLISPYQDHEAIKRAGEEAAAEHNVEFIYRDLRPLFREGQSAAREKKMYMQKYCGCIFSEEDRNKEAVQKLKFPNNSNNSRLSASLDDKIFKRLELLTGKENLNKLSNTRVLVFGAGGVGSWAAEALVRSGIGKIGIIDHDSICASNVNRQIEATTLTLGQPKASTFKKRLLEINPDCEITAYDELFCLENAHNFDIQNADYVIDAIDTLTHKLDLIETVSSMGIRLYSSMGMARRMDPSRIKISSIWKTEGCALARLVRQGLRKRKFGGNFTVVYSSELLENTEKFPYVPGQKSINGSIVTVTAPAGFMLASLVINDICESKGNPK
ncbi:MAG: epoxyqueuosine reductase QueH [Treponema sp.]|nr:epoxyqueuosine reductase QueH [Treponema sp.]